MNDPFGVNTDNRVPIPAAKKKAGFLATQEPHEYANQAIFESVTNHVWGTQAQTLTDDTTFYTDGSGNPLDKDAVAVTINEDDKILIGHNATATANLLLDAGGKKITIEMIAGVTLAMSTFDLTLGGSGDSVGGDIRITQTGTLVINGNRGLKINNSRDVYSDFTTKNLITDFLNSTQAKADADNIIFVDKFGGGKRKDDIDVTFDMTTDRPDGSGATNELASTVYQCWLDSDLNRAMLPDLVSVADANVLNSLSDSLAAFQTHLVQPNDEIYQTDDLIKGFVKAVSGEGLITCMDKDGADLDLFPLGTEGYKIRMLSPVGLGSFRARIFAVENDSGKNLGDSWYTQKQEEKTYLGDGTDFSFTVDPAITSLKRASATPYQTNDWTGVGIWHIKGNIFAQSTSSATKTATISGVVFKNVATFNQPITVNYSVNSSGAVVDPGTDDILLVHTAATANTNLTFDLELDKKPLFHN